MCLILFVVAAASFPEKKALINNLVDLIFIFPVPLLLRYAVKDQKNARQLCKNTKIATQKPVMNGDIRLSGAVESQNYHQEMVTIHNESMVIYHKRLELRNKDGNESNPDEIVTDGVDKIIVEESNIQ